MREPHFRELRAAPVLRQDVSEWFELESDSPYMLIVADVRRDRRRTMSPDEQVLFGIGKTQCCAFGNSGGDAHRLLSSHSNRARQHQSTVPPANKRFKALTGCPVLVNTSFNVRGEPIV
jgi:carbamoyltransferase